MTLKKTPPPVPRPLLSNIGQHENLISIKHYNRHCDKAADLTIPSMHCSPEHFSTFIDLLETRIRLERMRIGYQIDLLDRLEKEWRTCLARPYEEWALLRMDARIAKWLYLGELTEYKALLDRAWGVWDAKRRLEEE